MIDKLIKLVQQQGGDALNNNPAVPEKSRNEAAQIAAQQIFSGLQAEAKSGNVQNVISMFSGEGSGSYNTGMINQIASAIAARFATKFGMSPQVAQQIADGLVPAVINQLMKKTNDPADKEFDAQDILRNLTGNANAGDLLGKIGSGTGGALGGMFGK